MYSLYRSCIWLCICSVSGRALDTQYLSVSVDPRHCIYHLGRVVYEARTGTSSYTGLVYELAYPHASHTCSLHSSFAHCIWLKVRAGYLQPPRALGNFGCRAYTPDPRGARAAGCWHTAPEREATGAGPYGPGVQAAALVTAPRSRRCERAATPARLV